MPNPTQPRARPVPIGIDRMRPLPVLFSLILMSCQWSAPPCPDTSAQAPALSAGCLVVIDGSLLVVTERSGKISIPGGSSKDAESPRCTAHRETWEETGLNLQPAELIQVFDTGFHLYECVVHAESGEISPPLRFEVRNAFWLPLAEFSSHEWRFPEQRPVFEALVTARRRDQARQAAVGN